MVNGELAKLVKKITLATICYVLQSKITQIEKHDAILTLIILLYVENFDKRKQLENNL